MKKLLIATTALVATAGVAAAEVTISGNGRMGVVYNGSDLQFSSRVRADVNLSGTTDGGLEFGGSFGIHNAGDRTQEGVGPNGSLLPDDINDLLQPGGANVGNSGSVYISGAFGKLEMGDVVGAAEAVVGDLPEIGFTDIAANDTTFITGDGALTSPNNPVALYTYSTGAVTFAVSFNDGYRDVIATGPDDSDADTLPEIAAAEDTSAEYAIGIKYSFGDYSVSVGYERVDGDPVIGLDGDGNALDSRGDSDHIVVGAEAAFGTTTVKVVYGQADLDGADFDQFGLGVTSTFDAITVKGLIVMSDVSGDGVDGVTSYGLGAEYDLGGGAKVVGGIADNDAEGTDVVADLGLKFSF